MTTPSYFTEDGAENVRDEGTLLTVTQLRSDRGWALSLAPEWCSSDPDLLTWLSPRMRFI